MSAEELRADAVRSAGYREPSRTVDIMLDMGFTIAGFAAARGGNGAGAYNIRQL